MELTRHGTGSLTARVQHEPYGSGDVVAAGAGQAYLRFGWAGQAPRRLWVRYFDGTWRRTEAVAIGRTADGWLFRARVSPVRPALAYQLEVQGLPSAGGGLPGGSGRFAGSSSLAAGNGAEELRGFVGPSGGPYPEPSGAGLWQVDLDSLRPFATPAWVPGAVLYQIFPDRFFNARHDNDPPGTVPWEAAPTLTNFFGGDLEGIRRRLDYLADLGVGALYLNPIVQAPSNHRYDASDYLKVDPALGTEEDLRRLAEELHRRGMRLILDAVFNHTGETFWAFQDVVRRGPESPYFHWYFVRQWPIVRNPPSYECWWGLPHLPKLNTAHPEVREYLFQVTRHWMELGADGWRLDVPNEVGSDFWKEWRRFVKSLNPHAYIVGEIWHDALEWLGGDQFDAVMNYVLRDALMAFFVHRSIGARQLMEQLHRQVARYPAPAVFCLMNLLGSHDTERILTVSGGAREPVRAMFLWIMAWPGLPSIYYGDEVGLTGGKDPDCRRTFPWEERRQDLGLWRWVRRLAHLRRRLAALQWGEPVVVEVAGSDDVAAFGRAPAGPADPPVICVVSRSHQPVRVALTPGPGLGEAGEGGGRWVDLLSGRQVPGGRQLELELAPWGMALLTFAGHPARAAQLLRQVA